MTELLEFVEEVYALLDTGASVTAIKKKKRLMDYGIFNHEESCVPSGEVSLSELLFSVLSDGASDIAGCDATELLKIKITNMKVDR